MAEAYLKSSKLKNVIAISSGTVADKYRAENIPRITHIIEWLEKHGTSEYAKTLSEQLTQTRVNSGDTTICMNKIVADECSGLVNMPDNMIMWNVMDIGAGSRIVRHGEDQYKYLEETYKEITDNVDKLIIEKRLT